MSAVARRVDPGDVLAFMELVKQGAGHLHAAYSVNWTQHQLRAQLKDPSFKELLAEAEEASLEQVEETAQRLARNGNVRCIELILYNKGRHRGWRPPTQRIEHVAEGKVDVNIVHSVKAGVKELLASGELMTLPQVIDAEVVGED